MIGSENMMKKEQNISIV